MSIQVFKKEYICILITLFILNFSCDDPDRENYLGFSVSNYSTTPIESIILKSSVKNLISYKIYVLSESKKLKNNDFDFLHRIDGVKQWPSDSKFYYVINYENNKKDSIYVEDPIKASGKLNKCNNDIVLYIKNKGIGIVIN